MRQCADCLVDSTDYEEGYEPDVGFETQEKDFRSGKKSYEVDFKVISPQEIQSFQDKQIREISDILGQPPEYAAILLRHSRWNKERLIESYMDNSEQVLQAAGLGKASLIPAKTKKVKGFMCEICCDDEPGLETFAMKCGHRFCVDCYRQYLAQKIKDEGEAARIKCPGDACNRIVDSNTIDLLISEDLKTR